MSYLSDTFFSHTVVILTQTDTAAAPHLAAADYASCRWAWRVAGRLVLDNDVVDYPQ